MHMEIGNIIPHIEALIFASDKPLTSMEITELVNNAFGFMEEKLTLEQIQTSIDGIREKYASEFYPFEVRESGGGWQFLTKKDYHKTVAQLNGEKFLKRLSSAALETLSIIAYKQPITKGEIEAIRGVSSDYSIQKLLEKELIVITGRNEEMPGKPLVYSTSKTFMDYFGINSVADLPKIKEIFAETLVEPTIIPPNTDGSLPEDPVPDQDQDQDIRLTIPEEGEAPLIVSEEGELRESETSNAESEAPDDQSETSDVPSETPEAPAHDVPSETPDVPDAQSEESDEQADGDVADIPPYADDDLDAEPKEEHDPATGESDEDQ
jgi:segregation and condensation protein B